MGDASEVMKGINRHPGVTYSALTPNIKGLESAIEAGCKEVAIFAAATDAFSMRNINCNVLDSFERFKPLVEAARAHNVTIRGYVSCVVGCPYSGNVAPDAVAFVAHQLLELGCYEISLGDTIGTGTPLSIKAMLSAVKRHVPSHALAIHVHNTYGQGLANILASLEEGIAVVDASVAGLGGCPYARGASGNIATEDVVYMLHGMGIKTNVNLDALVDVSDWICGVTGRENGSKAGVARLGGKAAYREAERKVKAAQAALDAAVAAEAAAAQPASAAPSESTPLAGSCGVAKPGPAAGAAQGAAASAGAAAGAAPIDPVAAAAKALAAAEKDLASKEVALHWPQTPEAIVELSGNSSGSTATGDVTITGGASSAVASA